jgi:hypothetical protein
MIVTGLTGNIYNVKGHMKPFMRSEPDDLGGKPPGRSDVHPASEASLKK